jgi:hypothetical protein
LAEGLQLEEGVLAAGLMLSVRALGEGLRVPQKCLYR